MWRYGTRRQGRQGEQERPGRLLLLPNRDAPLPGDWFCSVCANHNHATHDVCHRWDCGRRRGPGDACTALPSNAWQCGGCRYVVYGERGGTCPSCKVPREQTRVHEVQYVQAMQGEGAPARDVRPRGFGGTDGGDPDLVHFVMRLFGDQLTDQEREDKAQELRREGEGGVLWVGAENLATYWAPRSRQRRGCPTGADMLEHVQRVAAVATDRGGIKRFTVDFAGLPAYARRFRLAEPLGRPGTGRASRQRSRAHRRREEPNFFAPVGGLLARPNAPLPEPAQIDEAQDRYMRDMQQRIEEELRMDALLRLGNVHQTGGADRADGQQADEAPLAIADLPGDYETEQEQGAAGDPAGGDAEHGGEEVQHPAGGQAGRPCAYRDVRLQEDRVPWAEDSSVSSVD